MENNFSVLCPDIITSFQILSRSVVHIVNTEIRPLHQVVAQNRIRTVENP